MSSQLDVAKKRWISGVAVEEEGEEKEKRKKKKREKEKRNEKKIT